MSLWGVSQAEMGLRRAASHSMDLAIAMAEEENLEEMSLEYSMARYLAI